MTIVKVVKQGNSVVVVLPKLFREIYKINEGDLVDISDIYKIRKRGKKK